MKFHQKKLVKTATVILGLVALIVAARLWYLKEQGNFHPITPGEAYRSAHLDREDLEFYIHKFGISSVINLRGKDAGEPWYKEQTETCRRLGVSHYDLGLSANKAPSSQKIEVLLSLFRVAPRPVLIQCQAGADRSGLAAALWKVVIDGTPAAAAEKQLSIRYGHMPFGPTQVLDAFFKKWVTSTKVSADTEKMAGEIPGRSEYAVD